MEIKNATDIIVFTGKTITEVFKDLEALHGMDMTREQLRDALAVAWTSSGRELYIAGYLQASLDAKETKH